MQTLLVATHNCILFLLSAGGRLLASTLDGVAGIWDRNEVQFIPSGRTNSRSNEFSDSDQLKTFGFLALKVIHKAIDHCNQVVHAFSENIWPPPFYTILSCNKTQDFPSLQKKGAAVLFQLHVYICLCTHAELFFGLRI